MTISIETFCLNISFNFVLGILFSLSLTDPYFCFRYFPVSVSIFVSFFCLFIIVFVFNYFLTKIVHYSNKNSPKTPYSSTSDAYRCACRNTDDSHIATVQRRNCRRLINALMFVHSTIIPSGIDDT